MLKVLTDIYPPSECPARDGAYLARYPGENTWVLRRFASGLWRHTAGISPCSDQGIEWIGLAFDPAAASIGGWMMYTKDGRFEGYANGGFIPGAEVV